MTAVVDVCDTVIMCRRRRSAPHARLPGTLFDRRKHKQRTERDSYVMSSGQDSDNKTMDRSRLHLLNYASPVCTSSQVFVFLGITRRCKGRRTKITTTGHVKEKKHRLYVKIHHVTSQEIIVEKVVCVSFGLYNIGYILNTVYCDFATMNV